MNVADAIQSKRAIRQFQDKPLPDAVAEAILHAGRLSGSAKNMQPWSFVAVRQRDTLQQLATCGQFCGHLAGAGMVVALVTPDPFLRLTVPFDLGRATQNMMLLGWEYGVGSVMATLYRNEQVRDILGVPPDYVIPWAISFGYPLDEAPRAPHKGGRRSLADIVHWEQW